MQMLGRWDRGVLMHWQAPRDFEGQAVFIVGGGPSIKGFDFDRLRGHNVIAVNNSGLDLVPWAHVLFWADKRWLEWNNTRLEEHYGKYKVSRKTPHIKTAHDIKVMQFKAKCFSKQPDAVGGWCGGSSAINLAYLMGAKTIILMGFDMRPGNYHDDHKLPHLEGQHRDKFIPTLEAMAPTLDKLGVTVINTNHRSALRCFPFADIEELLMTDDLANIERDKYIAIWNRPEYRKISPGMLECERAFAVMEMVKGKTLIDFGSGPARATKWFQDQGLKATAVDFAPNARETDVKFVEACLWDMPASLKAAEYGFCTDVMEHIPSDKVNDVLDGIAKRVRYGVYFRIATRPDKMGRLIGKPLHLTVQGGEWWRRKVEEYFPLVDLIEDTGRDVILLARH